MISNLLVLVALTVLGGIIAGLVALAMVLKWRDEIRSLRKRNSALEIRVTRLESVLKHRTVVQDVPQASRESHEPLPEPVPPKPLVDAGGPDVQPRRAAEPERPTEPLRQPVPGVRHRDQQWWAGLEERAGKRWMTWAGALALFLSAGFFLKYAFDNQWLGPTGRVALGIMAGVTMLVAGDRCLRMHMRPLGQGLIGGALAILYVSIFAAFSLYKLLPQAVAMGGLVTVTAAGVALAVLHDAMPLSFLAVLGGFITPLLVSTGKDPRDSLFCYLTLLNLGVLGTAFFKRWRALDVLAFVGTWLLFTGWYVRFYRDAALFPALSWVTCFFFIFLIIPFAYPLRSRVATTIESFLLALANAVTTFGYACIMLRAEHRAVLGFVALALCACYLTMGYLFRTRVEDDRRSVLGFIGLSVVFLTLAVPLHLRVHGITLAWALEGPVLLYLGYVYRYEPVRIAGALVLVLAGLRLFTAHWPLHHSLYVPFLNKQCAAAASVPLAAAVYAVIHYWKRAEGTHWDNMLMIASGIASGFLAIIIVHGEFAYWLLYNTDELAADGRYLAFTMGAFIWSLGTLGFLAGALRTKSRPVFFASLAALSVGMTMWMFSYASASNWDYYAFLNARFLVGSVLAATIGTCAYVAYGYGDLFSEEDRQLAQILAVATGSFLLILLSVETYTYCIENISDRRTARWAGQMSLTIVWGLFAVVALIIGFVQQVRAFRFAGLGLLALAGLKLVLVDMAQVAQIYRIVSFVVLGLLMIITSFLYHRLESGLVNPPGEDR